MLAGGTAVPGTRAERVPTGPVLVRALRRATADTYRLVVGAIAGALALFLLVQGLGRRDARPWLAWGLATLAAIATQPYGAFVLAVNALLVLVRRRWEPAPLRPSLVAIVAVTLAALPLWLVYRVLADRFGVGLSGSGSELGSPVDVLAYLLRVAGDFTVGWTVAVS